MPSSRDTVWRKITLVLPMYFGLFMWLYVPYFLSAGDLRHINPHTSLTPKNVVQIVMNALHKNNSPIKGNGIQVTYNFASPANKVMTGPVARFSFMIKSDTYLPMINHRSVEYEKYRIDGRVAEIDVIIISSVGKIFGYRFGLSLQENNEFSGSWMIDTVVPISVVSL
jgi:hypothetical protein